MNIHEHQAKKILKDYGAPVSKGIVILSIDQIVKSEYCEGEQGFFVQPTGALSNRSKPERTSPTRKIRVGGDHGPDKPSRRNPRTVGPPQGR